MRLRYLLKIRPVLPLASSFSKDFHLDRLTVFVTVWIVDAGLLQLLSVIAF